MSHVQRLSIRGIRNIPDDEARKIEFSCPVTLILGDNGTGKTTIIESLRYITTGECPPGTDKGKSFIHDPLLSPRHSTRATVKAEICDKRGDPITVFRCMEATHGTNGVTLKNMDNTLTRINKTTGKPVMISNRCADTNLQVSDMMGVSKSILNYVIFCHQDDSYWPLEGGKDLKARFDEIFGTLKYNKALESVRKNIKNLQVELREMEAQRKALDVILDEVKCKKDKLSTDKERRQELAVKIESIEIELNTTNTHLAEIQGKESECQRKVMEQKQKKMEYEHCEKEINMLKSNVEEIYEGSEEELNDEINSYEKKVEEKSRAMLEVKQKLDKGLEQEKRLMDSLATQRGVIGKLEQQMHDQKKRVQSRNSILSKALEAWDIDCPSSVWTEDDATELMKTLSNKYRNFERSAEQMRLEREKSEKEMQSKIDGIRTERSGIDSEMKLKDDESTKTREEIKQISNEILQVGTAANRLTEIEMEHQEASQRYDAAVSSLDVENVKRELDESIEKQKQTEVDLNKIDEEMSSLHRHSSIQAELELLQSSLRSKEQEIEEIKKKHEKSLIKLLQTDKIPMKKLRDTLEEIQEKFNEEKRDLNRRMESEQRQVTSLETTLKHEKKDLEKQIAEIEADKERISALCPYSNYEDTLALQKKKVSSLQDTKGMYSYQRIAYKKYLEELSEENACCPMCKRGFKNHTEIEKLKKNMALEVENHPETLKACEIDLKNEQKKYDSMLQMKPIVEKISHFETVGLKEKKERLNRMTLKLAHSNKTLEELQFSVIEPEENLNLCKSVITDIALWDQCIDEIEKLNRKSKASRQSLNYSIKSQRTIPEAQEERETLKKSLNSCRNRIGELQSVKNEYDETVQRARENKMSLQEELLQIRAKMQNAKQLKDKEKELRQKESSLNNSVLELRDKLMAVDGNLNSAILALNKSKKESYEIQEKNNEKKNKESKRQYELSAVQKGINEFLENKIEEKMNSAETTLERDQKSVNDLKKTNSNWDRELNRQKDDINMQEMRKKQLLDNLTLRKKQIEYKQLEREYVKLRQSIKEMKIEQLMAEKNELVQKQGSLLEKNHKAKGVKEEMDRAIKTLENELKKEVYREAEKNHRKKFVEVEATKEAVKNLNAYTKALDQAMAEYHQDRMATVNTIMRKMWSSVYTASDITSIQIRTEASGRMESLKRQFNYKLIQVKDGTEMDMKGRCSAGQRVLASIIIRMALAETFCSSCGVLALDEPTTNLDEHNARNLSTALTKIIQSRAGHQKNFQLIVISHDESFVRSLAKIDYGGAYYQLYRLPTTGKTVVKNWTVQDKEGEVVKIDELEDFDETEKSKKKRRTTRA